MRVTAGTAKGHRLSTPNGYDTRPTADKIKQSLFNMINSDLPGAKFLDLFSGTGQIGIEALSRGASECAFVESGRQAMLCIKSNLEHTKLADRAYTYLSDAGRALNILADSGKTYNIIFMDPPYEAAAQMEVLTGIIKDLRLLKDGGVIIGEHSADISLSDCEGINLLKEKTYGKTTVISFWTPEYNNSTLHL